MPVHSNTETIRRVFAAYRAKDREVVAALLADDFRFTSPYDDAIDKQTYFERCWPNSERIRQHELEHIFEQGDAAFVQYLCVTVEGKQFRNTEFFRFVGGKIASIDVYFGASYKDGRFVRQDGG